MRIFVLTPLTNYAKVEKATYATTLVLASLFGRFYSKLALSARTLAILIESNFKQNAFFCEKAIMEGKFLYMKFFNRLNRVLNGIGRNSLLGGTWRDTVTAERSKEKIENLAK
jgi:hypothetical protein